MVEPNLNAVVLEKFKPFQDEILGRYQDKIHSISIIGSALTDDFDPKKSDVNSVLVLTKMDLKFLEVFAPLGKKYRKKRVTAPLIMTPEYITSSLDVFPLEFMNIKLLHKTTYGEDLFKKLKIDRSDLRLQCERELKARMIGLRQGYISALGDSKILTSMFVDSFSGYIPLFRGIIHLLGMEPPFRNNDVLKILEGASGINASAFRIISKQKYQNTKLTIDQLNTIFEDYYAAIEKLGDITDDIEA